MNEKDFVKKIDDLMEEKDFAEKVRGMDSLADVAKAFSSRGVEITEEELKKALEEYPEDGGELDEAALANVAGGIAPAIIAVAGIYVLYKLGRGYIDGIRCKK